MANYNGKAGLCLAISLIILFNATHPLSTATSMESNRSTGFQVCNGSIHDCLIADDLDLDFFFDPELANNVNPIDVRKAVESKNQVFDAGKNMQYKSVYDQQGHSAHPLNCFDSNGKPILYRTC